MEEALCVCVCVCLLVDGWVGVCVCVCKRNMRERRVRVGRAEFIKDSGCFSTAIIEASQGISEEVDDHRPYLFFVSIARESFVFRALLCLWN